MRENAYRAIERDLPSDYVVQIMQRDLMNCVGGGGLLGGPLVGEMEEEGDTRLDTLELCASSGRVNDTNVWGDVQKIEYYLEEPEDADGAEGYDLVRAITRNLLASVEEDPEEERLLRGVTYLEFTYYDGEEWQDSWDTTQTENENPQAIGVRIEFVPAASGERDASPIDFVVEIVAETRALEETGEESQGQP